MGQYVVTAPCAYVINGTAVVHRKPGAVVELDDDVAASLREGVLAPVADAQARSVAESFADTPPADHVVGDESTAEPVVETRELVNENVETTNVSVPVEEPLDKPKRRGKTEPKSDADGQD